MTKCNCLRVSVLKYFQILTSKFNLWVTLQEILLTRSCQLEADKSRSFSINDKESRCDLASCCLEPKSVTWVFEQAAVTTKGPVNALFSTQKGHSQHEGNSL